MESLDPLILIGAGGHATAVAEAIRAGGRHRIAAVIDSARVEGSTCFGAPVRGDLPRLTAAALATGARLAFVAIGDNWRRQEATRRAESLVPGIVFATVVHPRATVAPDVELGPGSVVLPGAVVVSGSRLGRGCIVNTLASLDHEGLLGDFASLAPGVIAGGRVQVGEGSAVGLGARLVHRIRVGRHSVVGAGSLVLDDVPDGVVAYGSPARVIRPRRPDEPYL